MYRSEFPLTNSGLARIPESVCKCIRVGELRAEGKMPVNSTHLDYDAALPSWLRARDVFSGEDAIKAAVVPWNHC